MRIEHWWYTAPLRFRSLFRRKNVEQELDEELQFHIEQKTEEYIAQGLTPEQARLAALRAMHGLTQRKEECRDMRRVNLIENTARDIRFAIRILAKSPGMTAVAVLTLAMAIGANAVVFAIVNALILRPLNVPDAESLYSIQRHDSFFARMSYPDYLDLRDRNRSFDGLAAYEIAGVGLDTGGEPEMAWAELVSGNYFDVMRIQPHIGRFFNASDERGPHSAPYVVLSHDYWRTRFHEDAGVVGRVVHINKHPFTIIGVTPRGFYGTLVFFRPHVYVPFVHNEQITGRKDLELRRATPVFMTLGHLKPGVTHADAIADLNAIGSYIEKTYPKDVAQMRMTLARPALYGDFLGKPVRAFVAGLMLLAGLILVAACANLGSVFAARAADRAREVALRLALGASRTRILGQLMTEATLISAAGGAVGLLGSTILLRALSMWNPLPRFPIQLSVEPDPAVYALAAVLAIASGMLFGIVPVRQVLRTDPYQIVRTATTGGDGRRMMARDLLLVVQIAICAVLVTSSMVAVRGMIRTLDSRFGFEPRGVVLASVDLQMAGYRGDAVPEMHKRMTGAMQSIPGVQTVGLIDRIPLNGDTRVSIVFHDETADLRAANAVASATRYNVSPEYFEAAGTALLTGRPLTWHDDKNAPRVAVVNQEFARRIFGSTDNAVGRYFKLRDGARVQVVGIVEDGKYSSLTEDPRPAVFSPMMQTPESEAWLIIRSTANPQHLAAAVRQRLRELDAALPADILTWNTELNFALFPSRVATVALGMMGLMGAVLALSGIFGMAAYSVSKRLKELGIRMALGAKRKQILQAALGRAFKLLAIGSASGVILGIVAARVLASIVYQATPRDPVVLGGVVLAMLLLGLLATWIPAQRALSLNALTLLREE